MSLVSSNDQVDGTLQSLCIPGILAMQAQKTPEAPAILASGRSPLTYDQLYHHIQEIVQRLQSLGIQGHDRVALVLPNGPEMASAVLAVAAGATCIPLNPAYSWHEFEAYIADLHATALILQADMDSPAREVARTRGIHIIELSPSLAAAAGIFSLAGNTQRYPQPGGFTQPHDVAFVLPTSGTTSRPKLVPLTHINVCTSAVNTRNTLNLTSRDRALHVLPLFHAHGLIASLLTSLAAGASIICTPGFHALQFFSWLDAFHPTWYTAVPAIHQTILARAAYHREIVSRCTLRFIRSASAPLLPKVLTELEKAFQVPVIETYGMTESASQIASNPLPPKVRKTGSVGIATGPEVAIMDEAGTLLPSGATGEIVLRGATIMQGYENDAIANQSAFTQGWFRTGDQGFCDAQGYVFITGRLKEVINCGGEKIAPLEVDQVLMAHPDVAQAVTFAVPEARLGEAVAVAVVLHPHATATAQTLRQYVARRLAAFKVPQHLLLVHDIPKSSTGKVQRFGLAAHFGLTVPDWQQPALSHSYTAPRTPLEQTLAALWVQVLDIERVGVDDDFFQVGGDSILATQLLARIRDATQLDLSFLSLFDVPTVARMAKYIEETDGTAQNAPIPSLQRFSQHGTLPLSYPQQRLWFLEQMGIVRHAYTLVDAMRLCGSFQIAVLTQSLQEIINRHAILHTTFIEVEGQPYQVIRPSAALPLSVVDLRALPVEMRETQMHACTRAEAQRSFDLTQGPLLCATLIHLDDAESVLLLSMHHIVSDGWSQGVFWRELTILYGAFAAGGPSPLSPLPMQYSDFAIWQRQWLQDETLRPALAYWKQQLSGVTALRLPADYPRPIVKTFRGARYPLTFSVRFTHKLKEWSQHYRATLFMLLLTAFQTLLHRYTGQTDIVVGSLNANRNQVATEALIGYFVDTMVLRTDCSGDPRFEELLTRVRDVMLEAYTYRELPFEKLLEELRPRRDLSQTPLFQVLFVLQNTPRAIPSLPGLLMTPMDVDPETARFDLTLDLTETPDGLRGWFEYSTDLFEATTIGRMAEHFHIILESIVTNPTQRLSQLPLLSASECQQLLVQWNATPVDDPFDQCLHQVFEAQVLQQPDAVAVVSAESCLSYRELNAQANQVAHALRALGVESETLVGLCVERSLWMVVGLLGILKAGAAYVPLEPNAPEERIAFMIQDSGLSVVLSQAHLAECLRDSGATPVCLDSEWHTIAQYSSENPVYVTTATQAAYLLYTSGSTGTPKGVMGVHSATMNALDWMWRAYPFKSDDVCCQKTSMSFGDSIQELFGPLLQGVRTILIPDSIVKDAPRFVQTLATHGVTRMILVPSLLRVLLDTDHQLQQHLPRLRLWFVGGEEIPGELWQHFRASLPQSCLINLYGASEMSDDVTVYDTSLFPRRTATVPIGRPIANMQTYVLDRYLQPMPIGVPGELYVGGAGLTRGYFNRPALTAERFIPHPFSKVPGARLYKTGDLVRYLPDGNLEFLGRLDHQVKIRGIRIELGEIEAVLSRYPTIHEAVVTLEKDVSGEPRLVAYMVPSEDQAPTVRELRSFLKQTLPDALIPASFLWLTDLPRTPSGKPNRLALPAPDRGRPVLDDPYIAPQNPIEQQIAAIWADLLHLEKIGRHDDFFELGGHSLLVTQLVSRLNRTLLVDVSLVDFFANPTVTGLACHVETMGAEKGLHSVSTIVSLPRGRAFPVTVAQERIWAVEQMLPGMPFFSTTYAVRLVGPLQTAFLEQSCNEIMQRHEILRTLFVSVDGQPMQVIAPRARVDLPIMDLCTVPAHTREDAVQRLAIAEVRRAFNLTEGPLLRFCLLCLDEQEYRLLVTIHHIISDGWSLGILVHELGVLYDAFAAGMPSPLPALPIQYVDFANWQRQWQQDNTRQAQLAYWKEQLRPPLPVLALPTDYPRQNEPSIHTAREHAIVPQPLYEALRHLSIREHSTLFTVLAAAFKVLLYTYTGQQDLCVATLVANRQRWETETLIGLVANTVILRTSLSGNPTYRQVLHRVQATMRAAYAHQDLPFEELAQALERDQGTERQSLCQAMCIFQNAMLRPVEQAAYTLHFLEVDQGPVMPDLSLTTLDIILVMRERPKNQGLAMSCIYKPSMFKATTIQGLLTGFQEVLEQFCTQLEQVCT